MGSCSSTHQAVSRLVEHHIEMVSCVCNTEHRMCQCGLHAVLWLHNGIPSPVNNYSGVVDDLLAFIADRGDDGSPVLCHAHKSAITLLS